MRKLNLVMIIVWSLIALMIMAALVGGILYRNTAGSFNIIGGADDPTSIFVADRERTLLVDETLPLDSISEINVDLMSETVDVFPAEDNQLRVVQYGRNLEADRVIDIVKSGSSISIQRPSTSTNNFFNFSFFNFGNIDRQSWVEIYLPASYQSDLDLELTSGTLRIGTDLRLKDLTINMSSGTIKSGSGITAANADIEMTSGLMNLERLDAGNYNIDVSSGTVHINEVTGSGDIEITSGSLKLFNVTITDKLYAQGSSGTMDISLAGNPSLQFQGHVSSGSLKTYFEKYSKDDYSKEYFATVGEGPYKELEVEVTSGNVRITSAEGVTDQSATFGNFDNLEDNEREDRSRD